MAIPVWIRRLTRLKTSISGQIALFAIFHILILVIWFNFSRFDIRIHPDVELYLGYADLIFKGSLPYRDFAVEYPPLAMLFLAIPRLFSSSLEGYANGFAFLMLFFDLAGLVFISRITLKLGLGHFRTLLMYTAAFWALGDIAINRFDVIPAIFLLAALYYFIERKHKICWLLVGLGALTKIYPLIIIPLLALNYWHKRKYRTLLHSTATLALIGLVCLVPFIIASPEGFWQFITFHSSRGLQLESTYASTLMLGQILGIAQVEVVMAPASVEVTAAGWQWIASISYWLSLAGLLAVYYCYYVRIVRRGGSETFGLIGYILGAIVIMLITSKIFSTQFVIWLYPIVPVIVGRFRYPATITFILIALLSSYIFPHHYTELVNLQQPAVGVLIIRNLLVFGLGIGAMIHRSVFYKRRLNASNASAGA